jgi:hypothetical protein
VVYGKRFSVANVVLVLVIDNMLCAQVGAVMLVLENGANSVLDYGVNKRHTTDLKDLKDLGLVIFVASADVTTHQIRKLK